METDRSTLEDMAAIDYGAYAWNARFVSAIVAEQKLVAQLLSRFEGLTVSRIPRQLFTNEADARAWIASVLSGGQPAIAQAARGAVAP